MPGTPTLIADDVVRILECTTEVGDYGRPFLTAYQILQLLPDELRSRLISEYCRPGKGGGKPFSAATAVAKAAELLKKRGLVEISMLNTNGIELHADDGPIEAGSPTIGLYRLRR